MEQYKTTGEMSAQWGVTARTVQNLCRQGKIEGAVKRAGIWFILDNTQNPLKNTKYSALAFEFVGTKKKIFNNALKLFIKKGFENVTAKEIAGTIGIRQSAVYNHYSSKQNILDTIYDFYAHYLFAYRPTLDDIEPILQNGSPLEIITSVRYEFEDAYIKQKMLEIAILIFQRQGIDERAQKILKAFMIEEGILFTEKVLNRAVEIGRLAPFDMHTIALLVVIIRMYTLQISIIDPSPEGINTMLKDEHTLYELTARHLTELKKSPSDNPLNVYNKLNKLDM